jgi:hypothetical protein
MNTGKDLGTYHVRVELEDGRGWIQEWTTGRRFVGGSDSWHPLDASSIPPQWSTEDEVISAITGMFFDGNYACDCNKKLFLAYSKGKKDVVTICGDTLKIKMLSVICPDGRIRAAMPKETR